MEMDSILTFFSVIFCYIKKSPLEGSGLEARFRALFKISNKKFFKKIKKNLKFLRICNTFVTLGLV